jgi:hypothetical protein
MWCINETTMGALFINKLFECYTLEDADRFLETGGEKIPKQTAIPRGKYRVIVDWSERFNRPMPHLLDVPQFDGIRIHILNTSNETEGCVGVGDERTDDTLIGSTAAFNRLFKKIFNTWVSKEEIWLEVV